MTKSLMTKLNPSYFFALSSYEHQRLFDSCTYVWEALCHLRLYLQNTSNGSINGKVADTAYLINPETITIGEGSIVEPGAYIEGPCVIGKECTIRHGAYLRGNVLMGDRCVVGHDSELKHSILLDEAQAPHFAYVGDSILGNGVNLGAGTICANLKLDRHNVLVHYEEAKIETGMRKLGLIAGDGSQTGCNVVTNPGTLFGKHVICYPGMNIGGFIPSDQVVKPETNHYTITAIKS